MAVHAVNINEFLVLARQHTVLDVRTSGEYNAGHIPGAHHLPLFTNEERVIIGTIYKQQGREPAILKGLELVGPKMKNLIEDTQTIVKDKNVLIHCWRGGMRSGSVAWLLDLYGFNVYSLKGGYKFFRKWVLENVNAKRRILILGGYTGSGKTLILRGLAATGQRVIDLEALAHHKGSSFGSLGAQQQPTQEQFENELAIQLTLTPDAEPVWLEDESRTIGKKVIPQGLWEQMSVAKVVQISLPLNERVNYLVQEYGKFSKEELKEAISRISRRLGGLETQTALQAIDSGDLTTACRISLNYYDKSYDHGLNERDPLLITTYKFDTLNVEHITLQIIHQFVITGA